MTLKSKITSLVKRENIASTNTYESIKGQAGELKYQDPLVRGNYHDFWDNYSRREVVLADAIGNRITIGFLTHVFQKFPKFVPNDEVQSEYIMDDVRQALEALNIKGALIEVGVNYLVSGWSLLKWDPNFQDDKLLNLSCKTFGWYECHPRYWHRSRARRTVNTIYRYDAIYTPRPLGMEGMDQTLSEERYYLSPIDPTVQHLTRLYWNQGHGISLLYPIWDAITKLRERSNDEHFLKSLFWEVRYSQQWTPKKAKAYVDLVRKATRTRGLATEAVMNPQTNEDTGLPSAQIRPWGQGPQGSSVDVNKASAYLDGEWLRLLVNLGYSQVWATGTQAGATEGSEINLTRDDRADIAQFTTLEPMFKKIFAKLTELGVMSALGVSEESQQLLLSKKYRMQCWLTWEYNDKAALQQEQLDHEMEMKKGDDDDRNAFKNNSLEAYNNSIQTILMNAMRNNFSMPMTPVMSAWIKKIGFDEGSVYMQTHEKTKQGIDTYEYNPNDPEALGSEWLESGSKGGFWWDSVRDKLSPAFKHGQPPSYLETGYGEDLGFTQPRETREYKIEGEPSKGLLGAGTTREPFQITTPLPTETEPYAMPEAMYNPTVEPSIQTTAQESVLTPGYVRDPSSITGTKKVGPGRKRKPGKSTTRPSIVPYNPTLYNSALLTNTFEEEIPKMLRMGKKVDWHMSKNTAYNFLHLVKHLNSHVWRCNLAAMGNEMAFDMPLYYQNASGGVDVEFACPDAFKEIKNHTGNLYLYPNLGHEGERVNVGTYERIGWDDEKNQPITRFNYDDEKIVELLTKWNKLDSNIMTRIKNKMMPEMSTEYFCLPVEKDGKILQTQIHNSNGEPVYEGIAIVDYGNCDSEHCQFTLMEEVDNA